MGGRLSYLKEVPLTVPGLTVNGQPVRLNKAANSDTVANKFTVHDAIPIPVELDIADTIRASVFISRPLAAPTMSPADVYVLGAREAMEYTATILPGFYHMKHTQAFMDPHNMFGLPRDSVRYYCETMNMDKLTYNYASGAAVWYWLCCNARWLRNTQYHANVSIPEFVFVLFQGADFRIDANTLASTASELISLMESGKQTLRTVATSVNLSVFVYIAMLNAERQGFIPPHIDGPASSILKFCTNKLGKNSELYRSSRGYTVHVLKDFASKYNASLLTEFSRCDEEMLDPSTTRYQPQQDIQRQVLVQRKSAHHTINFRPSIESHNALSPMHHFVPKQPHDITPDAPITRKMEFLYHMTYFVLFLCQTKSLKTHVVSRLNAIHAEWILHSTSDEHSKQLDALKRVYRGGLAVPCAAPIRVPFTRYIYSMFSHQSIVYAAPRDIPCITESPHMTLLHPSSVPYFNCERRKTSAADDSTKTTIGDLVEIICCAESAEDAVRRMYAICPTWRTIAAKLIQSTAFRIATRMMPSVHPLETGYNPARVKFGALVNPSAISMALNMVCSAHPSSSTFCDTVSRLLADLRLSTARDQLATRKSGRALSPLRGTQVTIVGKKDPVAFNKDTWKCVSSTFIYRILPSVVIRHVSLQMELNSMAIYGSLAYEDLLDVSGDASPIPHAIARTLPHIHKLIRNHALCKAIATADPNDPGIHAARPIFELMSRVADGDLREKCKELARPRRTDSREADMKDPALDRVQAEVEAHMFTDRIFTDQILSKWVSDIHSRESNLTSDVTVAIGVVARIIVRVLDSGVQGRRFRLEACPGIHPVMAYIGQTLRPGTHFESKKRPRQSENHDRANKRPAVPFLRPFTM